MENIRDNGDGTFTIIDKGITLSLAQLIGLGAKQVKSEDEMIDRAISQEFSRAKTKHFYSEYARIVLADRSLLAMVEPFEKTAEDFRAIAELKVKKTSR